MWLYLYILLLHFMGLLLIVEESKQLTFVSLGHFLYQIMDQHTYTIGLIAFGNKLFFLPGGLSEFEVSENINH